MKHWLVSSCLVGLTGCVTLPALAQRVLLHADVAEDTTFTRVGPNRAYFSHFFIGYTAVVGQPADPGADLRFANSGEFFLGLRNKFRLSQTVAVGLDLRYARLGYYLEQNDQKILPTPAQHHRELLALQQLQGDAFVRFNYGRRGNSIGRYVDLLGWGGYLLGSLHYYEDRPGPNGTKKLNVTERGLPYLQRWPYGVGARVGFRRLALIGRYRFSDTFVGAARQQYPELPRLLLGVELSWL